MTTVLLTDPVPSRFADRLGAMLPPGIALDVVPTLSDADFDAHASAADFLLVVHRPIGAREFGIIMISIGLVAVLLATIGMATLGCLFAAMVAQLRARELLLPLLTLPLWIPFIVAGGQAVQSAMGASGAFDQAVKLLLDFDILFVVLTSLTARFVLDD